jgi:hypothetical protein
MRGFRPHRPESRFVGQRYKPKLFTALKASELFTRLSPRCSLQIVLILRLFMAAYHGKVSPSGILHQHDPRFFSLIEPANHKSTPCGFLADAAAH